MLFDHPEFDDHEQVCFHRDPRSGLSALLVIHRSVAGRAGGGIRFYPYDSIEQALTDALRLSRAMTYKFALADFRMGGGKTVVVGDPKSDKTHELLHALGDRVEGHGGRYVCGPDVGTNSDDMVHVRERTRHVAGLPSGGGNTSAPTSKGVFNGLRAVVEHVFGHDDLSRLTFAVQGVGAVGGGLCDLLHQTGAKLVIADVDDSAASAVAARTGARITATQDIVTSDVDVLCPCALGGVLDELTIPQIRAKAICGGANNQLATSADGERLRERGIVFAPDYVVNAGGVIAGTVEIANLDQNELERRLAGVYDTTRSVLERARRDGVATEAAAQAMAEERLADESR